MSLIFYNLVGSPVKNRSDSCLIKNYLLQGLCLAIPDPNFRIQCPRLHSVFDGRHWLKLFGQEKWFSVGSKTIYTRMFDIQPSDVKQLHFTRVWIHGSVEEDFCKHKLDFVGSGLLDVEYWKITILWIILEELLQKTPQIKFIVSMNRNWMTEKYTKIQTVFLELRTELVWGKQGYCGRLDTFFCPLKIIKASWYSNVPRFCSCRIAFRWKFVHVSYFPAKERKLSSQFGNFSINLMQKLDLLKLHFLANYFEMFLRNQWIQYVNRPSTKFFWRRDVELEPHSIF